MNQYLVVIERSGPLEKVDGKASSEVIHVQMRYVAYCFDQVYNEVMSRLLPDDILLTIHQEAVGVHLIKNEDNPYAD